MENIWMKRGWTDGKWMYGWANRKWIDETDGWVDGWTGE